MKFSVAVYYLPFLIIGSFAISYDGDQVWRLFSDKITDSVSIQELLTQHSLDVWKVNHQEVDFRIPSHKVEEFGAELKKEKVNFKILIDDVGKLIKDQTAVPPASPDVSVFELDKYHPFEQIIAYLDFVALENPMVSAEIIGKTNQERQIKMVKISVSGDPIKPAIWMDCGIHAREWVSPATCLWGLNLLLKNYGNSTAVTEFLNRFDVYMVPVLNPDGYDYTWNDDRLWRKNRMKYSENACIGTDLNRNYGNGNFGGIGASADSCSDIYHGPFEFSELETQAVRDKITEIQTNSTVLGFYSIHSYGQLWLFPYASIRDLPVDNEEMFRVSQSGVDAIFATNGMVYVNGPHFSTIYPASGTSVDWGYTGAGITNSYIVELRDDGTYGFLLPEDQIVPTATEAWNGFIQSALNI